MTSPRRVDLLTQARCGIRDLFGLLGGDHVFPKEAVIDVTSGVEANGWLEGELRRDVSLGHGCAEGGEGVVEVGDVGLVVFSVVQGHDLGGDGGFKGL